MGKWQLSSGSANLYGTEALLGGQERKKEDLKLEPFLPEIQLPAGC